MPKFKPNTGFRMESPLKDGNPKQGPRATKKQIYKPTEEEIDRPRYEAGAKKRGKNLSPDWKEKRISHLTKKKIRQSKKKSVLEYKKPAAPKMYGKKSGAPKFMGTGAIGMLGQVLNRRK